jgi:hypothetical protein
VIRDDLPAVVQAITSPYSSGVNEGRITDVKLQKRIMTGRAKFLSYANESYSSHTYAATTPQVSPIGAPLEHDLPITTKINRPGLASASAPGGSHVVEGALPHAVRKSVSVEGLAETDGGAATKTGGPE